MSYYLILKVKIKTPFYVVVLRAISNDSFFFFYSSQAEMLFSQELGTEKWGFSAKGMRQKMENIQVAQEVMNKWLLVMARVSTK